MTCKMIPLNMLIGSLSIPRSHTHLCHCSALWVHSHPMYPCQGWYLQSTYLKTFSGHLTLLKVLHELSILRLGVHLLRGLLQGL